MTRVNLVKMKCNFFKCALIMLSVILVNNKYVFCKKDSDAVEYVDQDAQMEMFKNLIGFYSSAAILEVMYDRDTNNETNICYQDLRRVMKGVNDTKMWALKMVDASSKMQSGLLRGNLVDFGQYDECLDVKGDDFQGQHCLVHFVIPFNVSHNSLMNIPSDLLNGKLTLTSSLCVPSTCQYDVIETLANNIMKMLLSHLLAAKRVDLKNHIFSPNVTVIVKQNECHIKKSIPLTLVEYVVIAVCFSFVALVIVSSVFDILMRKREGNRMSSKSIILLRAFSAPRNTMRLLNTKVAEDSLSCINGARFLSIAWVALGHRYKFICQNPMVNFIDIPESLKDWWSMLIVNATLSVDVFFILGGLLNSYVYMRLSGRNRSWKTTLSDFLHRYLRLTPSYALMIAITATWLYRLGDGPQWDSLVGSASSDCRTQWLPGLLYINNYYNVENYCMMQSWYLAADMQMFWLSPILLYPLRKWPFIGLIQGAVMVVISMVIPFYIAYANEIKTPIPLSKNREKVQKEMELLYLPTHTKTISYIIGILLGYLIHLIKTNKIKWNLTEMQKIIGWIFAFIFLGGSLFGAHPIFQIDHPYNRMESSLYIGFYRLFWSLGVSWILLMCCTGGGGILQSILNSRPLLILGRLTYGIYLTHVAIILVRLGSARQPVYYDHYDQLFQFFGDFSATILCALILTLCLESPFLVIEKIIIRRRKPVGPENGVNLKGFDNHAIETDEEIIPNSNSNSENAKY